VGKDDSTKDLNLIGHGTTFEGKVRSQGAIRVDGRVVGEITAYENVSIGTSGEVEGNINAKNITIGGKVRGSLAAQEKMVFLGQAVVQGDIRASKLVIDEGAVFDGKCSMTAATAAKTAESIRSDVKPNSGVPQQKQ
jgi:cytoskeletal protein CcmA (bactofilin family)